METRQKRRRRLIGKWACYALALLLAGVLMGAAGFLSIGAV